MIIVKRNTKTSKQTNHDQAILFTNLSVEELEYISGGAATINKPTQMFLSIDNSASTRAADGDDYLIWTIVDEDVH